MILDNLCYISYVLMVWVSFRIELIDSIAYQLVIDNYPDSLIVEAKDSFFVKQTNRFGLYSIASNNAHCIFGVKNSFLRVDMISLIHFNLQFYTYWNPYQYLICFFSAVLDTGCYFNMYDSFFLVEFIMCIMDPILLQEIINSDSSLCFNFCPSEDSRPIGTTLSYWIGI